MSQREIVTELHALKSVIEEMTGLKSRWNGEAHVLDAATMLMLKGRLVWADKEWACAITLNEALLEQPIRWRSLIHEMLHSVSVGMNREDYTRFRGWEEAVIEQTQRQIRPDVLARLDIEAPEAVFLPHEAIWPYNNYIEAIETLRQAAGMALKPFYLGLLRTPLAQRPASVRSMSDAPEFRRLFALALGKMR